MNRQELWEDCYKNLVFASCANPYMLKIIFEAHEQAKPEAYATYHDLIINMKELADDMVDVIISHRDEHNRKGQP